MNKERLEAMCAAAMLSPVERRSVRGFDVFVADGFERQPYPKYARYGVNDDEFLTGCFVTLWWVGKGEKLDAGGFLFCEPNHNPELANGSKAKARVKAAFEAAEKHVKVRRRVIGHA